MKSEIMTRIVDIFYKRKWLIIFSFFCIFFFLRLINIDSDIPGFGISFYQPMDEGLYSKMAINLFKNNSLYSIDNYSFYTAPTYTSIILANLLQYICLNIFGNNYFAFRLPYFIASLLTVFFVVKFIFIIKIKFDLINKHVVLLIISTLIYFCVDFSILLSSRVVENSSFRYMIIAMLIYFCFKNDNINKKAFYVSFISVLSVFFIYFSNIFLVLCCFFILSFLLLQKDYKIFFQTLKYIFLGAILALTLAELYYFTIWGKEAITILFEGIFDYGNRISVSDIPIFKQYVMNFMHFVGSNIFMYNTLFFIIGVVSFFYNGIKAVKHKDLDRFFIFSLILSFVIMTIFTNDYYERKAIVIFPAILASCIIFFVDILKSNINILKIKLSYKISIYIISVFIFLFFLYSTYKIRVWNDYLLDFSGLDIFIILLEMVLIAFVLISFFCLFIINDCKKHHYTNLLLMSFGIIFFVNIYFSSKYVYFNNSYTEKNAMIDIGKDIDDSYVIGPYSYSYSLYNNIHPITNTNEVLQQYIKDEKINYYIFYSDLNQTEYLDKVIFNNTYSTVILYREYQRKFSTFGYVRNVGLFIKNDNH